MAIIHELSPHLADLIAAGEVVERPASVAKELIENSIDAGATSITIELQNGGITYLRITDNGIGISPEDAPIAFRRHATSKIRHEEDLSAIGTLGFRGEALAAISSVSRISLFTKQRGAIEGTHLELEAGVIQTNEVAGCPEGTTFIIRDLFYNTPARMKFLKKDFTEANYILSVVQHAALSNPEVAFKCIKDGKNAFISPGSGDSFSALFNVFGKDLTATAISVDSYELNGIKVWGYISKPHAARANRSLQHFFVNGRYVKSRLVQAALEEAYKNSLITGKYPYGCLYTALPLNMVDVNVHPTKTEVKFAFEKQVFDAVYAACKNALSKDDNVPELKGSGYTKKHQLNEDNLTENQQQLKVTATEIIPAVALPLPETEELVIINRAGGSSSNASAQSLSDNGVLRQGFGVQYTTNPEPKTFSSFPVKAAALLEVDSEPEIHELIPKKGAFAPSPASIKSDCQEIEKKYQAQTYGIQTDAPIVSTAKVIGQCFDTYIVAEDKDGLIFIDKHAAHERLIFNKLRNIAEIPTQLLLSPVVCDFSREEFAAIAEGITSVCQLGFEIEQFGEQSFIVRQAPAYIDSADIGLTLSEVAQKLMDKRSPEPDKLDDLIHTVSCKAAIKAGSKTSAFELQDLCSRVLSDPEVTSCPHGRPVTVRLTKYEMDKLFKRVNQ